MNGGRGDAPLRERAGPAEEVTLPTVAARPERLPPASWYPEGDPRVRAVFLRLRDGERVRVLACGAPEAAPVVLLHGWACSAFSWRHQLPALADAGYYAVAVDLRGHGLSDVPDDAARYGVSAMAGLSSSCSTRWPSSARPSWGIRSVEGWRCTSR